MAMMRTVRHFRNGQLEIFAGDGRIRVIFEPKWRRPEVLRIEGATAEQEDALFAQLPREKFSPDVLLANGWVRARVPQK
jgi:hypothetical protein